MADMSLDNSDRWTGKEWSDFLSEHPQFAGLCKWERLDGDDWADLLSKQPQFKDQCPFEKLNRRNWGRLLVAQPDFVSRLEVMKGNLDGFDGRDWIELVGNGCPSHVCPWDKLGRSELVELLSRRPELLWGGWNKDFVQRLDGGDYAKVYAKHLPRDWRHERWEKKLSLDNWVELISVQPQIAGSSHCPWKKLQRRLTGRRWAKLLAKQPQFSVRCPWNKLDRFDWAWLLLRQPQFVALVPWEEVQRQKRTRLKEPGDVAFPFDWFRLDASCENTSDVYVDKVPLDRLNRLSWVALLTAYPRFADRCPRDKLYGSDWMNLLAVQPQVSASCPWNELVDLDWSRLLAEQPQFANGNHRWLDWIRDWGHLLSKQPQFADLCPWDNLCGFDWIKLLSKQPQFADRCPWDKLNELDGQSWQELLSKQPQFADRCPWDKLNELDGWRLVDLLSKQPQFADRCPWGKLNELDGYEWVVLLSEQPQFADRCSWDKLDVFDWERLLKKQPQLADRCPREIVETFQVFHTFPSHPQIARYFSDKLDGWDWSNLLAEHPELASYCRWNKLDWTDWQWLLAAQPQFSDRVPWESLPGYDWLHLLFVYPRSVPPGLFKRLFKRMLVHDFKESVTRIWHCCADSPKPNRWTKAADSLVRLALFWWLGVLGFAVIANLSNSSPSPAQKTLEPEAGLMVLLLCPILGIPVFFILATIRTILVLPLHIIKLIRAKRHYEKAKKTQELIQQTGFEASDIQLTSDPPDAAETAAKTNALPTPR